MPTGENKESDTLCLIYADRNWDITPEGKVVELISKFQKTIREGSRGDANYRATALDYLRKTRPVCVRLRRREELTGTLEPFKSYKSAEAEARYVETVFNGLDVTKVRCIRVYTRPPSGERGFYKHCDLNMVISVTIS